jgi:hypothetical protein
MDLIQMVSKNYFIYTLGINPMNMINFLNNSNKNQTVPASGCNMNMPGMSLNVKDIKFKISIEIFLESEFKSKFQF